MAEILSKISPKHKGVLCIISSAFCFAFMGAFVRLAGDLPSVQKSFFRNLVAFIFAAAILIRQKGSFLPQKKSNIGALLIRSVCGTLGILCNFYAVDHLALSDAAMLNKMSPFFVIVFSALFLRERTNLVQTFGVIVAFAGSLLIIKPSLANLELVPSLLGFLGGMGAGAAYTAVRWLGIRGEKGPYIVFFFSGFSCLVTLPFLTDIRSEVLNAFQFNVGSSGSSCSVPDLRRQAVSSASQRHINSLLQRKYRYTIIRR